MKDAIDILNQRIAELEQTNVEQGLLIVKQHNENERLREMNQHLADSDSVACLQDAERYRWSRDYKVEVWDAEDNTLAYGVTPMEIDESYDAAMEGQ